MISLIIAVVLLIIAVIKVVYISTCFYNTTYRPSFCYKDVMKVAEKVNNKFYSGRYNLRPKKGHYRDLEEDYRIIQLIHLLLTRGGNDYIYDFSDSAMANITNIDDEKLLFVRRTISRLYSVGYSLSHSQFMRVINHSLSIIKSTFESSCLNNIERRLINSHLLDQPIQAKGKTKKLISSRPDKDKNKNGVLIIWGLVALLISNINNNKQKLNKGQ